MFTASGLLVRFLKVFEKGGYQSVKVRRSGSRRSELTKGPVGEISDQGERDVSGSGESFSGPVTSPDEATDLRGAVVYGWSSVLVLQLLSRCTHVTSDVVRLRQPSPLLLVALCRYESSLRKKNGMHDCLSSKRSPITPGPEGR